MDLIKIYCYTGIPVLTYNMLFYSLTSISQSITSSQNVVKFISEHKICDSEIYKSDLEIHDLPNKLKIVESLIFDVIKRHCKTENEYTETRTNLLNPIVRSDCQDETGNFQLIELNYNHKILDRIDEPVRYALMSTAETICSIHELISNIQDKILKHNDSYLNKFVALCLKKELKEFNKQNLLLDKRLQLLLELLKIYNQKNI